MTTVASLYNALQAQSAYYPNSSTRQLAKLWATEKFVLDMAAAGFLTTFEGPGANPTLLPGYAPNGLWLDTTAGVTSAPAVFRYWNNIAPASNFANWPAMSGMIPLTLFVGSSSSNGADTYQGQWNASTNSPALASGVGSKGFYYDVSVAGSTALDGITQWAVGDRAVFTGTAWTRLDGQTITYPVVSVAGRTGAIALAASDITYTAPGTGGVSRSVQSRLTDGVSAYDYGVVGDGVTDDTTAMVAALAALPVGGCIFIGTAKILTGNITVPAYASIRGQLGMGEQTLASVNPYSIQSQIILKVGATITMAQGSSALDVVVSRAGLSLPVTTNTQCTTLLGQFSGTAFTSTASCTLSNVYAFGHAYFTQVTLTGTQGRFNAFNCRGDNTNGFSTVGATDICRFYGCHMWPYLTAGISGASNANLRRAGSAYYMQTRNDWSIYVDCFSYGYDYGFQNVDAVNIAFVRCQADSTPDGVSSVGFNFTAVAAGNVTPRMSLCTTIGYVTPVQHNAPGTAAGFDALLMADCILESASGACVTINNGSVIAHDNLFQGGSVGVKLNATTTANYNIHHNRFLSNTTAIVNSTAAVGRIEGNPGYNPIGTGVPTVGASPWTYTAGASPETHYIWSGTITAIAVNGQGIGPALGTIHLEPFENYRITYTVAPTVVKMVH